MTKTKAGALKSCKCREFTVIDVDSEAVIESTGCDRMTNRLFAQGHDAKLKSMLIRAGAAGYQAKWWSGTEARTLDPLAAARDFGFGSQVEAGIRGQLDKLTRRAEAKAKKAARPEPAPQPEPRQATIKLGRWTYEATIDPAGLAAYSTKGGEAKTAEPGSYTEV